MHDQSNRMVNRGQALDDNTKDETSYVYLRLPYIGSSAAQFKKSISNAINKCYESVQLRLIFTSRPIFPNAKKDVLPTLSRSDLIYQFKCHCDSVYVGKTDRRLSTRVSEHVPKSLRERIGTEKADGLSISSAIGQHLRANPQCFAHYKDSAFTILAFGRPGVHLSALESFTIREKRPILCRQKPYVYSCPLFSGISKNYI